MVSDLQLIANQLNAAKSTGPRTEAGKNIARFNARRHGLTGQFYCMSEDDELAYNAFEKRLLESLKPGDAYETQLAISIIQDQWRLNRSRSTEFNLYGQGHDEFAESTLTDSPNIQVASTMADTFREDQRAFANIALYETRIHRMIAKNEKRLSELQAERKAAEETARDEAKLLLRLAHFNGEAVDSKADIVANGAQSTASLGARVGLRSDSIEASGFVFSIARLTAEINREDLLNEARSRQKNNWSRDIPGRKTPPTHPKAA
jgi:hypothetical protein